MRSKNAIINVISSVSLQLITIICGFIIPKLMITHFGSDVNGLVHSITQFLAYITLLESGFGPVVKSILFKPISNKDKRTIEDILKTSEKFFRKIALIFVAYILVLCVAFPIFVSGEFDNIYTISLVLIIAVSTFAEYYFGMTYQLFLQAEQKRYVISIINITTIIINTIAIIVLVKLGASIQIVKLATALIFVLRPILQNIYVKKKYNINLKKVNSNYNIKQKWDGLAQHIAYVINNNTDVVILTLCTNTLEVSVYAIYAQITNGIKSFFTSLTNGIVDSFGDMIAKGEKDNLNKSFKEFTFYYIILATIVFAIAGVLILPFVSWYTRGVTDVNYIRPAFAIIVVLTKYIWTIRKPFEDLTKAAGHFKETRIGAWVEAVLNIVISLILVWYLGLTGVAIGTLVSMVIRTIEFMYHCSKYILG